MIFDKQQMFSDNLALTTAATSYSDIVDVGRAKIAKGESIGVFAQVNQSFTSTGAGTFQAQLYGSPNADMSGGTLLYDTGTLAKTTVVQGYQFGPGFLPLDTTSRYYRWTYTIGTTAMTAGSITTALVFQGGQPGQTSPY